MALRESCFGVMKTFEVEKGTSMEYIWQVSLQVASFSLASARSIAFRRTKRFDHPVSYMEAFLWGEPSLQASQVYINMCLH